MAGVRDVAMVGPEKGRFSYVVKHDVQGELVANPPFLGTSNGGGDGVVVDEQNE